MEAEGGEKWGVKLVKDRKECGKVHEVVVGLEVCAIF